MSNGVVPLGPTASHTCAFPTHRQPFRRGHIKKGCPVVGIRLYGGVGSFGLHFESAKK
jgi:hypothetical protein